MTDTPSGHEATPPNIEEEIENYLTVLGRIRPHRAAERLETIDVYGESHYLSGAAGGDHIIYLNFDQRYDIQRRSDHALSEGNGHVAAKVLQNRDRIGVLLADVNRS